MRLLIQRVSSASVTIAEGVCGQIGRGLLVFFGVHRDDEAQDTLWLKEKLLTLRIFPDETDKMNRSIVDVQGGILIVSQFTLYGSCTRGRRPEFTEAAPGEKAEELYEKFVGEVRSEHQPLQTGRFGLKMAVSLVNDGPVTLIIDGKRPVGR